MEASGGCEVCGGDGGGEGTSFMDRRRRGGDGVGGKRSCGCIADVEGVFGDLESALAVGVEEDVSGFRAF